ncbi:methyltransferase family protein [Sulfitobacter sp.]|uniref:methyltransferase family protein n=1 Tax=Sulfitobacter sp. TaxID=1903071 RepID=UPI003F6B29E1
MNIPPLAQLLAGFALAGLLATYLPLGDFDAPALLVLITALSGGVFLLPAVESFVKHETTVNPQSPSQATTLVTDGIYSITRNPMYVGMLIVLMAFVVWLGAPSASLAAGAFFLSIDRFQIRAEERFLGQNFGKTYEDYTKRVPRWLIVRTN